MLPTSTLNTNAKGKSPFGTPRKSLYHPGISTWPTNNKRLAELDDFEKSILDGSHPEYQEHMNKIQKKRQDRIAVAEGLYKYQVQNYQSAFEATKKAAFDRFYVSCLLHICLFLTLFFFVLNNRGRYPSFRIKRGICGLNWSMKYKPRSSCLSKNSIWLRIMVCLPIQLFPFIIYTHTVPRNISLRRRRSTESAHWMGATKSTCINLYPFH